MDRILAQMKVAPKSTYGRVNYLQAMKNSTGHEVKEDLESSLDCKNIVINFHPKYLDCIIIPPLPTASAAPTCTTKPKFTRKSTTDDNNGSSPSPWPQHQRVILVDRYCGEAVLRGAHIYVRGILCADVGIQPKELVAVSLCSIHPMQLVGVFFIKIRFTSFLLAFFRSMYIWMDITLEGVIFPLINKGRAFF
jgi:hypothetical protein